MNENPSDEARDKGSGQTAIPVPTDLIADLAVDWQAGEFSARKIAALEDDEHSGLAIVRRDLKERAIEPGRLWLLAAQLVPLLSEEAQALEGRWISSALALCLPVRKARDGRPRRYGVSAQTYKRAIALARARARAGSGAGR